MNTPSTPIHLMTAAQLRNAIEHMSGLPMPAFDGPNWRAEWAEWEVASHMLQAAAEIDDKVKAVRIGVEWCLQFNAMPVAELRPVIERVLGRALTDREIETGTLAD